jgi:hypothetical protein
MCELLNSRKTSSVQCRDTENLLKRGNLFRYNSLKYKVRSHSGVIHSILRRLVIIVGRTCYVHSRSYKYFINVFIFGKGAYLNISTWNHLKFPSSFSRNKCMLTFICHLFSIKSRDISVGTAVSYGLGGSDTIPGRERLFSSPQRPDRLWDPPPQPPTPWVPGALSQGVKWQGHEADHSTPPIAEVNNCGAIPPLPPAFMA